MPLPPAGRGKARQGQGKARLAELKVAAVVRCSTARSVLDVRQAVQDKEESIRYNGVETCPPF